jgi:2-polyprenyl-3-methyl-5-hydroxy-6-metoxy-1,4-benzoquinol methylase
MQQRHLIPEWMDAPDLDIAEHQLALAGLRRINQWSGTAKRIANEVQSMIQQGNLQRCRILDLGCGSGDIACSVAQRLAHQVPVSMTGWDFSETAVQHANENRNRLCRSTKDPYEIRFEQRNVLDPLPAIPRSQRPFDIVYCSLFLHHFTDGQAMELLNKMASLAELGFIVDDLVRSRGGWLLAHAGCRILSRSRVVHFDGPQSVRAAFTISEIRQIAAVAGLHPISVRQCWPARFLLKWKRPL